MDPINVLKVFVKLEKDIAAFYGKLKNISLIREFVETYEKMESQSINHADRILNDYNTFKIPELNVEPLIVLHNDVKERLLNEIKNESNVLYVLQKLANAEEQLGKIYKSIAVHYKKNAEKYQMLSEAVDKIGNEEFAHRDYILKEMEKRAKIDSPPENTEKVETGLSYSHYKKIQSTISSLKSNLDDLKLRDNERAILKNELKLMDQTLRDSKTSIRYAFDKCTEILKYQKSSPQAIKLIKQMQDSNAE